MTLTINSTATLYNGVEMPIFGLGLFRSEVSATLNTAVKYALEIGYRSFDTASMYQNEEGVGRAIRESGIPRDEIFITTKIWNSDQGYQSAFKAFDQSLNKLQTDYIDLYLIHWPKGNLSIETWHAMEELYLSGKIRAIGVSNFLIPHLNDLMSHSTIKPMVNQYEFHPWLVQPELLAFCTSHQIQPEAWRPIMYGKVNEIPTLKDLAAKYCKSPVQIVLRWNLQKGVVTIPKSSNPVNISHNVDIFDFELNDEDMALIDGLDRQFRLGEDPNNFSF